MNDKLANHLYQLTSKVEGATFEERAFGMAYIYAVVMLAWGMSRARFAGEPSSIDWAMLKEYAKSLAPKCHKLAEGLNRNGVRGDIEALTDNVFDYLKTTGYISIFSLSDFYLLVKEGHRKSSNKNPNVKIGGMELLHRTQFFSEPYMANALLRSAFKMMEERDIQRKNVVVVDPAVGAGNILLCALDMLIPNLDYSDKIGRKHAEHILGRLIGYDLDPMMKELASLGLGIAFAIKTGHLPNSKPKILSGESHGSMGFFDQGSCFDMEAIIPNGCRVIITNPPYLGRRMMDPVLREYIKNEFPSCKGDMCASFILRCGRILHEGDILALVHQNTFFHLSSLESARKELESIAQLRTSVQLGAGAFCALSGEKTNVSLSIFEKLPSKETTPILTSVSSASYEKKRELLENAGVIHEIESTTSEEVQAHVKKSYNYYKNSANPMQGSSTGNNEEMVRFLWEKQSSETDWVLASKGGGYARWWGLNRFLVYWGENGERIKEQSGSALRNSDKQSIAQLVYSDTGSSGLNVRVKRSDQVFMASGPGIVVQEGNQYAHLAFLNSRFATYFLRKINPKLTISAGYLGRLPFSQNIAKNQRLVALGVECVSLKQQLLSTRLVSADTNIPDTIHKKIENFDEFFLRNLVGDTKLELAKLKAENEIESEVMREFGISKKLAEDVRQVVSMPSYSICNKTIGVSERVLDAGLSRYLSTSLGYRNGVKLPGGISADGPLEALALTMSLHPEKIAEEILKNPSALTQVKSIYLEDAIHKVTLGILGFNHIRDWEASNVKIQDVAHRLQEIFPDAQNNLIKVGAPYKSLKNWLTERLPIVHSQSFFGCPILFINEGHVGLYRV